MQLVQPFASEELCHKAAEAISNEINAPIVGKLRAQTLDRARGLLLKKDK
jgi:hypothetical protein